MTKKSRKRVVKKKLLKSKISKGLGNSKYFQRVQKEIKIDLSTLKFCPDCASNNIFYSKTRDEIVCRDCGGIFSKLTPEQMAKYKGSLK